MAWNGAGAYVLNPSYYPEVNGTVIDAVRYNGLLDDVGTGITAALAKNGENSPTANINWGGFKISNVAAGAVAGDAIIWGQNATLGYGTLDWASAAGAFQSWKIAGAAIGYVGSSEGTSGQVGGTGLRSETFMDFSTGATFSGRWLANTALVIGGTVQAGAGGGADKLAVHGSIGFTQQLNGTSGAFVELVNRGAGGMKFYVASAGIMALQISAAGVITDSATNELGYKGLPSASVTSGAFVAADRGKVVFASGGVTVPNGVMALGDVVTIQENTGVAQTITASVTTLRLTGTALTGNRTLAPWGRCTILFSSPTTAFISGDVS
jgi:hypothetical protein